MTTDSTAIAQSIKEQVADLNKVISTLTAERDALQEAASKLQPRVIGHNYTYEQLQAGLKARKAGKSWSEVAKVAGVRASFYFSNVLRWYYPEVR